MEIDRTDILRAAITNQAYREGNTLFAAGMVGTPEVKSFWKDEMTVEGPVEAADGTFISRVDLAAGHIHRGSCSCGEKGGLCAHQVALLLKYKQMALQEQSRQMPVHTTFQAHQLLLHFSDASLQERRQKKEGGGALVRLIPCLSFGEEGAYLTLRIGREKPYLVKNIWEMVSHFRERETAFYGKNLEFLHVPEMLEDFSRRLLRFIEKECMYYVEIHQGKEGSSGIRFRSLFLLPAALDEFFELYQDRKLDVEDLHGQPSVVMVENNVPSFSLQISPVGRDGIRLFAPEPFYYMEGLEGGYLFQGKKIYRCSEECFKNMAPLWKALSGSDREEKRTLLYNKKEFPAFCKDVLPRLQPYLKVEAPDMDLNSYIPESLQASFFVEKNREGGLLCTCRFTYGQKDFNPLNRFEERQLPLEMYRDMGRETIILEVLQSWFPFQNENMQCLMPEGDDTIFEFLLHGIGELSEFGEVYLEGALKTMHILPGPPLQMGISLEGNLLQIHVDMGESTQEELLELVKSYREKKRFYKCRNGTFIRLDQEEAGVLGELIQGLHLKDKDFQKNVLSVPGNRALFLDRLVKNSGMPVVRNQAYRSLLRDFKTYEDNDYELPIQLEAEMRGYQIQGFRWLKTLRQYGFGGILADEMGLGKTLQVIAFLLSEKENQKEKYRPALVVCPASLVYNWFNEFHKFAPAMSCLMLVGDQIARRSAMASAQGADIWITSYDLLRRDLPYYREFDFSIQVVDEAQFIKNKNTQNARAVKTVNAAMRIALTGTPIENRLSELWSIFDYLMPGYLFSYKYFREQIELPIVREQNEGAIARLHKMIGPFVLRRLKTQVLSELPDKMEEIVYSRLEGEQHKLYNGVALLLKKQLEGTDDKDFSSQKLQILAQLMRLRQICCDPSLCFEGYTGESAKRIACLQLVRNAVEGGHKILVFSQFTSMLALLESSFTQEGITSYTLTGNTPKDRRMQLVQAFQKDETPVFLISLKAGGTGLNLTAADIVIHYDPWWNSSVQNQATDRTHRIGQEKVVSVFKLITENTIEEKIRQLQEKKHQLAEDVLAGEQVSLSTLTRQDLLEILA